MMEEDKPKGSKSNMGLFKRLRLSFRRSKNKAPTPEIESASSSNSTSTQGEELLNDAQLVSQFSNTPPKSVEEIKDSEIPPFVRSSSRNFSLFPEDHNFSALDLDVMAEHINEVICFVNKRKKLVYMYKQYPCDLEKKLQEEAEELVAMHDEIRNASASIKRLQNQRKMLKKEKAVVQKFWEKLQENEIMQMESNVASQDSSLYMKWEALKNSDKPDVLEQFFHEVKHKQQAMEQLSSLINNRLFDLTGNKNSIFVPIPEPGSSNDSNQTNHNASKCASNSKSNVGPVRHSINHGSTSTTHRTSLWLRRHGSNNITSRLNNNTSNRQEILPLPFNFNMAAATTDNNAPVEILVNPFRVTSTNNRASGNATVSDNIQTDMESMLQSLTEMNLNDSNNSSNSNNSNNSNVRSGSGSTTKPKRHAGLNTVKGVELILHPIID